MPTPLRGNDGAANRIPLPHLLSYTGQMHESLVAEYLPLIYFPGNIFTFKVCGLLGRLDKQNAH